MQDSSAAGATAGGEWSSAQPTWFGGHALTLHRLLTCRAFAALDPGHPPCLWPQSQPPAANSRRQHSRVVASTGWRQVRCTPAAARAAGTTPTRAAARRRQGLSQQLHARDQDWQHAVALPNGTPPAAAHLPMEVEGATAAGTTSWLAASMHSPQQCKRAHLAARVQAVHQRQQRADDAVVDLVLLAAPYLRVVVVGTSVQCGGGGGYIQHPLWSVLGGGGSRGGQAHSRPRPPHPQGCHPTHKVAGRLHASWWWWECSRWAAGALSAALGRAPRHQATPYHQSATQPTTTSQPHPGHSIPPSALSLTL